MCVEGVVPKEAFFLGTVPSLCSLPGLASGGCGDKVGSSEFPALCRTVGYCPGLVPAGR